MYPSYKENPTFFHILVDPLTPLSILLSLEIEEENLYFFIWSFNLRDEM